MTGSSRLLHLGIGCAASVAVALCAGMPAHAQDTAPSAASIPDLTCPRSTPGVSRHVPAHNAPPHTTPKGTKVHKPAREVIHRQPLLDAATRAGFAPVGADKPRRFAIWGDSHIAAGPFAPTLLRILRQRGLDVQIGFMPPMMGRANVRLPALRASCAGPGLTTTLAYTSTASQLLDIGPAVADRVLGAGRGNFLWLDLRNRARQTNVSRVRLFFKTPHGATLHYRINDGKRQTLTIPATHTSRILPLNGSTPVSVIKLDVSAGELVLQGFSLEHTTTPDVVLDVFGIPSSTVSGWANADPASLKQSLHGITYDGVVLEYGTNEGADPDYNAKEYTATLTTALTHLRQVFPHAACLLVGPPDRGVSPEDRDARHSALTYSKIHQQIEQIQRRVGKRFHCASWSWQSLMGGPGGAYEWEQAEPRLMAHDFTHLTAAGYRATAKALARSLGWTGEADKR